MSPEYHEQRQQRFARIRRAKWLLRFLPRRARFHHYPLIGRFADIARKRDYLWSFRTESVRPAIYAGAILALSPLMGLQVGIAFVLSLLLRANLMVLIGLQFITTPFTFLFIYKGTYEVGRIAIESVGFETSGHRAESEIARIAELHSVDASLTASETWWAIDWSNTIFALLVGGLIAGVILGAIMDLVWRIASGQAEAHRLRQMDQKLRSGSTPPIPPPE